MLLTQDGLQSFAVAHSVDNFVDASDFEAMAINFAIEQEMADDTDLFNEGLDEWMDNMERQIQLEAIIESGEPCDICTH